MTKYVLFILLLFTSLCRVLDYCAITVNVVVCCDVVSPGGKWPNVISVSPGPTSVLSITSNLER